MDHIDILKLGWAERWTDLPKASYVFVAPEGCDYHILDVIFGYEEGLDLVSIICVPHGTLKNEREVSETHFYGLLKNSDELRLVMEWIGVVSRAQNAGK